MATATVYRKAQNYFIRSPRGEVVELSKENPLTMLNHVTIFFLGFIIIVSNLYPLAC